jgi:hypothetical protein
MQGFAEADEFTGTAIAILVHAAADLRDLESDKAALLPLESSAPGQTLLTMKTAELLRGLPGLPLQLASEPDSHEVLWKGTGNQPSRSPDEEAVSRLIKLHGLEDDAPPVLAEPVAARPLVSLANGSDFVPPKDLAGPILNGFNLPAFLSGVNPRLLMATAGAAAIALVILIGVIASHRKTNIQAAAGVQPSSQAERSVPGAPPSPQSSPIKATTVTAPLHEMPVAGHIPTPDRGKPTQSGQTSSGTVNAQIGREKPAASKCDLDPNLIPKALDQAEKSRDRGSYDAAIRQFRSVLSCEPDNARARSGLERVLFAKEAEK